MLPNRESPRQYPVLPVILSKFSGSSSCAQQGGKAVLRVRSLPRYNSVESA